MLENTSLPRVVKVKSTMPINDDLEVFDMMSRFLASEKAKQLSHDFAGQAYLASCSQTWNDLRQACNSLLERNDPRREPVAAWKEQIDEVVEALATPIKTETTTEGTKESATDTEKGSEKKSKKKKRKLDNSDDDSENGASSKKRKAEKKAMKEAKKQAKKEKKEKKSAKKAKAEAPS